MSSEADYDHTYHQAKWQRTAILVAALAGVFAFAVTNRTNDNRKDPIDIPDSDRAESKDESLSLTLARLRALIENPPPSSKVALELRTLESVLQDEDANTISDIFPKLTTTLTALQRPTEQPSKTSRNRVRELSQYVTQRLADKTLQDQHRESNLVRSACELVAAESRVKIARAQSRLQTEIERRASLQRQLRTQQDQSIEFAERKARLAALQSDQAEVTLLLKPFTTPGHYQPASRTNAWDLEWTAEARPVSLSRLARLGALEESPAGLRALYIVGGAKAPGASHDRPLGSFPQCWAGHLEKPKVRDAVESAQQLLRKHGKALIEQGMLSP